MALCAGGHVAGDHIADVRENLRDWTAIGPSPYTAFLDPSLELGGPAIRRQAEARLLEATRLTIVGHRQNLADGAATLGPSGAHRHLVERRALASFAAGDDGPPPDGAGGLLHEPHLGYVAAFDAACGGWHVLVELVDVRWGSAGVEFTTLRRRRPTLIRLLPCGAEALAVGRCRHGRPTIGSAP